MVIIVVLIIKSSSVPVKNEQFFLQNKKEELSEVLRGLGFESRSHSSAQISN
jgi:hypothetical protein